MVGFPAGSGTAFGIAGMGLSIFGGIEASQGAQKKAEAEMAVARSEQALNDQRRLAMETANRRAQTENVRRAQVQRSLALAVGNAQTGSTRSSGTQGGMASAAASGNWNTLGMSQQLQIGERSFDISQDIFSAQITAAQGESMEAQGQGLASIGKGLSSLGGMGFMNG